MVSLMKLIKVHRHFILEKNGLGEKILFFMSDIKIPKVEVLVSGLLIFTARTLNFFHNKKKM